MVSPSTINAGIGAGGSILGGLIGQLFAGKNDNRRADLQERQSLINDTNDFEKFLAQMQATDPQHATKDFIKNRRLADIVGGSRGTGYDFKTGKVTGVSSEADRIAADPALGQIINTLQNAGKSNLNSNPTTGLLDFVKPQLELATTLKGDKANFTQGGASKTFGSAAKPPRQAQPKMSMDDFLREKGVL